MEVAQQGLYNNTSKLPGLIFGIIVVIFFAYKQAKNAKKEGCGFDKTRFIVFGSTGVFVALVAYLIPSYILLPVIIGIAAIFGLAYIPANIARKKGYGFAGFYIFGIFLFLVALIVALCLSDKNKQLDELKKAIIYEKNNENGGNENV